MKLSEYKKEDLKLSGEKGNALFETNIECPQCNDNLMLDLSMAYLTNPPQHTTTCKCGYSGSITF